MLILYLQGMDQEMMAQYFLVNNPFKYKGLSILRYIYKIKSYMEVNGKLFIALT
jgi:hypothetical protein